MDDKEYLKNLIAKFNLNSNDETLNITEKKLLARIVGIKRYTVSLVDKKTELEKQLGELKKSIDKLNSDINREITKSDTYVEALCLLRQNEK